MNARPLNFAVAERGHEQVERRTRPFLVDEMKERLVHANGNEATLKF